MAIHINGVTWLIRFAQKITSWLSGLRINSSSHTTNRIQNTLPSPTPTFSLQTMSTKTPNHHHHDHPNNQIIGKKNNVYDPNPGTESLQCATEGWIPPVIRASVGVAFSFRFREQLKAIAAVDGHRAGVDVPQSAIVSGRYHPLGANLGLGLIPTSKMYRNTDYLFMTTMHVGKIHVHISHSISVYEL